MTTITRLSLFFAMRLSSGFKISFLNEMALVVYAMLLILMSLLGKIKLHVHDCWSVEAKCQNHCATGQLMRMLSPGSVC